MKRISCFDCDYESISKICEEHEISDYDFIEGVIMALERNDISITDILSNI